MKLEHLVTLLKSPIQTDQIREAVIAADVVGSVEIGYSGETLLQYPYKNCAIKILFLKRI